MLEESQNELRQLAGEADIVSDAYRAVLFTYEALGEAAEAASEGTWGLYEAVRVSNGLAALEESERLLLRCRTANEDAVTWVRRAIRAAKEDKRDQTETTADWPYLDSQLLNPARREAADH